MKKLHLCPRVLGAAATPGSLAGGRAANASEVGFIQSLHHGISVRDANLALSGGGLP